MSGVYVCDNDDSETTVLHQYNHTIYSVSINVGKICRVSGFSKKRKERKENNLAQVYVHIAMCFLSPSKKSAMVRDCNHKMAFLQFDLKRCVYDIND